MNNLFNESLEANKENKKNSLEDVWDLLEEFKDSLKQLGLDVTERLFCREYFFDDRAKSGIPVVSDGLDGARVSFNKKSFEKHGIEIEGFRTLNLWFTNGFEKPENKIRQKIQAKWDELMKKYFDKY
ncbi:MAG TPA: hypothetical protein PKI61_02440 [bacterium]|nr:hypothetical protein [bacterium]HPT30137.1 hypothetical protein [bacterium]